MTGQTALPGHRYPHRQPAYWARHNCPALSHTTRVVYLVLDNRQGGEIERGEREGEREKVKTEKVKTETERQRERKRLREGERERGRERERERERFLLLFLLLLLLLLLLLPPRSPSG